MVKRRKAWNGNPPETAAEARRYLLTAAQHCIERYGPAKARLSDVATEAGVTRQTVYRYFEDADELFNAAAVLANGGFIERMRARVLEHDGLAERFVETLVISICEIPKNAHLSALAQTGDSFSVSSGLKLFFVQEEMLALGEGNQGLAERERDELAELLLRLLKSFLTDPGPERSEQALREYLYRWLIPLINEKLVNVN